MVKLTISLPDSTQITLESDDYDAINRVLNMVLHKDASNSAPPHISQVAGANGHGEAVEKSKDAFINQAPEHPQSNGFAHTQSSERTVPQAMGAHSPDTPVTNGSHVTANSPGPDSEDDGLFLESFSAGARDDFVAFCQNLNPMGDMRRVVVAAEGAGRFFRTDGVTADELGELFDLVGWRRANSFTQTLRNAARSKFGWLERIPGRAGRYAATDHGRTVTMGG